MSTLMLYNSSAWTDTDGGDSVTTAFDDTTSYDETLDASSFWDNWYNAAHFVWYDASGTRTSEIIDLSQVGITNGTSTITWTQTIPTNTTLTVQTNLTLDGVTWQGWQTATNGGSISGITNGLDLSNAQLQIKESLSTTDQTTSPSMTGLTINVVSGDPINTQESTWQQDSVMDAKFNGNLEAGNLNNGGVAITGLVIQRQPVGNPSELVTLTTLSYTADTSENYSYTDMTAPIGEFRYFVIPLGENGLLGTPNHIDIKSDFYGWWIVDPLKQSGYHFYMTPQNDSHNMMVYGAVTTKLNQGRVEIDTMSQYPQTYYFDSQYHTFDLSALMNPQEYSFSDWQQMVSTITQHKPLIVKAGSGDIYVADVYAPQKQSLLNVYQGVDYYVMTVSCMEVADYIQFMNGTFGAFNQ